MATDFIFLKSLCKFSGMLKASVHLQDTFPTNFLPDVLRYCLNIFTQGSFLKTYFLLCGVH